MKLIRYGSPGHEKPGIRLEDGTQIDVSSFGEDYDEGFFGTSGMDRLGSWLVNNWESCDKIPEGSRLGPPLCRPSKLVCVGLNYAQHAKESGMAIPKEPVIFFKATSAIVGPNDDLVLPKGSTKTDWEVELAVVIGKKASYVNEEDSMDHIAGYLLHNDYSEREFQLEREGQWVKGKSCDTFAPLGPVLVDRHEIKDPHDLELWLKVNGKTMQHSNTSDLVFKIPKLVSYITSFMTLLPGDVISTGTPFGVAMGMKPPCYLQPGDVVELGIERLGLAMQSVTSHA